MNNDKELTLDQIAENRRKVVETLLTNPLKRDKIQLSLTDGGTKRCSIGLGLEALGFDMSSSRYDELYRTVNEGAADYMDFEVAVGYFDPDNDICEFMWNINDEDDSTFADVGYALAVRWGIDI